MARVTVCIPTYNSCATLPGVLKALEEQEFRDFQLIICDDGSRDGTWEFLQRVRRPDLAILRNEVNMSLAGTMKRLFDTASGEFVCIHHDHEYVKPTWLSTMISLFEAYPGVGMAVPAYDLIDSEGRAIGRPRIAEDTIFRAANPLPGHSLVRILATLPDTPISAHGTVFRASHVKAAGGYSDAWGLASDEDLYRRVAEHGDVAYCSDPVVVVVARPRERQFTLGSFAGLYTIYEFRKDTTRRYWKASRMARRWNLVRLSLLTLRDLVRESARLWMLCNGEGLELALAWDTLAALPAGYTPLSAGGKAVMTLWVSALRKMQFVGRRLGRLRRPARGGKR
jgi:glycosyltransferase involved in cell wall biosynthesis